MQGLVNFFTNPGVTALLGVVLGVTLKGIFDIFGENRRLQHEITERKEQRAHEAAMQEVAQREAIQDQRTRAYARFLGMAHTIGNQMRNLSPSSGEDLRALSESYAEVDVMAIDDKVRQEAFHILNEALHNPKGIIDTDDFVNAIKEEKAQEGNQ